MTKTILVAYATKHGSTREVAERLAASLEAHGLDVDLRPAATVADLSPYAGVVLGGSLYTGRWHGEARRFLRRHSRALAWLPFAAFALGPKTLDEADVAGSRAQLERALAEAPEAAPLAVTIFGGVVDPAKLHFPFSKLPASDARDWDAVEAWAATLAATFGYGKSAREARDPRTQLQQSPR